MCPFFYKMSTRDNGSGFCKNKHHQSLKMKQRTKRPAQFLLHNRIYPGKRRIGVGLSTDDALKNGWNGTSSLFFGALDRGTEKRSSKTGFYSRVLPPPLLVERPTFPWPRIRRIRTTTTNIPYERMQMRLQVVDPTNGRSIRDCVTIATK